MLSDDQLRAFGVDGYLVVPEAIPEPVLAELDEEVDALVAVAPPAAGKVGFHHYFEHPSRLPIAERALRRSGVLELAGELVAPLTIDLAFDHIQVATSIFGWDHQPEGGHIDGYGLLGQTEPATFTMLAGVGRPVLASRGDVILAHDLLANNQSGNMWNSLRRIVYHRLAAEGHRPRRRRRSRSRRRSPRAHPSSPKAVAIVCRPRPARCILGG